MLSSNKNLLQSLRIAIDNLIIAFGSTQVVFRNGRDLNESLEAYSLQVELNLARLEMLLPQITPVLLKCYFTINVEIKVSDYNVRLSLHQSQNELYFNGESSMEVMEDNLLPLPEAAVGLFEEFKSRISDRARNVSHPEFYKLLQGFLDKGVDLTITFSAFLQKSRVNNELLLHTDIDLVPRISSFLFLDTLISLLKTYDLQGLKSAFFEEQKPSIICVFDYQGFLSNNVLAISGTEKLDQLDAFLQLKYFGEARQKINDIHHFHLSQNIWLSPVNWIIPETFQWSIKPDNKNISVSEKKLQTELMIIQAQLLAIFLADRIEENHLDYTGLGKISLVIAKDVFLPQLEDIPNLFALYKYAFDGLSPDKLEITQQFISLSVRNFNDLLSQAEQIQKAVKKAYDQILIGKVKDYFDIRQKLQERLKTAITETTNTVLGITRDTGNDVYKAVGIIGIAILTAFLKPEVSLLAFRGGLAAIAIYMMVILVYYLPTIYLTYQLRIEQHKSYLDSFSNVLSNDEMKDFNEDKQLISTQKLFGQKFNIAKWIYIVMLAISILGFVGSDWLHSTLLPPSIPSSLTPIPVIIINQSNIIISTLTSTPQSALTMTPTP